MGLNGAATAAAVGGFDSSTSVRDWRLCGRRLAVYNQGETR